MYVIKDFNEFAKRFDLNQGIFLSGLVLLGNGFIVVLKYACLFEKGGVSDV